MKILISGGTQGLGKALVKSYVADGHQVFTFSRQKKNVEALQHEIDPEKKYLTVISGDIASTDSRAELLKQAVQTLGSIDLFISNVGIFTWDENLKTIPESDILLPEDKFIARYKDEPEFVKQQNYRNFVLTNYTGNAALIDAVVELATDQPLTLAEVGSVGGVADMIGKPFPDSTQYGHYKAKLAAHTIGLTSSQIKARFIHPGPFGDSAQKIADKYGDTWSIPVSKVAIAARQVFDDQSATEVLHAIVASDQHFSKDYFGDLSLLESELPGISRLSVWIPESESEHLIRSETENLKLK